jgi:Major Facilitator Superfamily
VSATRERAQSRAQAEVAADTPLTRLRELAEAPRPRRLGAALAVIAAAQLMVMLDGTIVNVALPHIQRALHLSGTDLEWVVNAYTLAFGGLLLGGRSGDLLGRRRMLMVGIALFALASHPSLMRSHCSGRWRDGPVANGGPGRTGNAPARDGVPANSLSIGLLRLDSHTNIAVGRRHARDPQRTLKLLQTA